MAVRIVRPRLPGLQAGPPGYLTVERGPEAKGAFALGWRRLKRALIGRPIRSAHEVHERLTKVRGLAVFSSDNISSSTTRTSGGTPTWWRCTSRTTWRRGSA